MSLYADIVKDGVFQSCIVFRMRVEAKQLTGVAADDLAAFYIGGRAEGTYATYSVAFKKVWEHGRVIGRSVFRWGEGEVAGLLVLVLYYLFPQISVMTGGHL